MTSCVPAWKPTPCGSSPSTHAFHASRGFQKIGSADVAHEDKVPGYDSHRLIRPAALIFDEKTEVFRGVARRVDGGDLNFTHMERVAVF